MGMEQRYRYVTYWLEHILYTKRDSVAGDKRVGRHIPSGAKTRLQKTSDSTLIFITFWAGV